MPELPEVETIRLQLNIVLPHKRIKKIEVLKEKSFIGDPKIVIGKKIAGVRRFGKMLVMDLSNDFHIVVHLKMSGQLLYGNKNQVAGIRNKYTRVVITFTDRKKLIFNDMRIFGWIRVVDRGGLHNILNNLGPDPLREMNEKKFYKILQTSKRPIKLVLMDQEKIGGIGNIYANDALFLSKVNPKMQSNKLSKNEAKRLFSDLQKVLKDGIKWGGASKTHFRDIYGQKGEVQEHFYVYNREGEKCLYGCGSKIKKIKLGGRGTFFCPNCQAKLFLLE